MVHCFIRFGPIQSKFLYWPCRFESLISSLSLFFSFAHIANGDNTFLLLVVVLYINFFPFRDENRFVLVRWEYAVGLKSWRYGLWTSIFKHILIDSNSNYCIWSQVKSIKFISLLDAILVFTNMSLAPHQPINKSDFISKLSNAWMPDIIMIKYHKSRNISECFSHVFYHYNISCCFFFCSNSWEAISMKSNWI